MKIDADALEEALNQLATDKLLSEIREAITYGPPVLKEILDAYTQVCSLKGNYDNI